VAAGKSGTIHRSKIKDKPIRSPREGLSKCVRLSAGYTIGVKEGKNWARFLVGKGERLEVRRRNKPDFHTDDYYREDRVSKGNKDTSRDHGRVTCGNNPSHDGPYSQLSEGHQERARGGIRPPQ